MSAETVKSFNIGRNDYCFCGSGERFKRCCGDLSAGRKIPEGIVIIEDYLSIEQCQEILQIAESRPSERLKLIDSDKTTAEKIVRKFDENRVTRRVDMSQHQDVLNTLIRRAISSQIEPGLGHEFDWYEEPQLLKYEPGGFYAPHADSENFESRKNGWSRVADRDISVLVYLSDDFEGGEILFTNFQFKLKPRAGMLVYFPSDNWYVHTALPVTSGTRYAIVSWLSERGVEKLRPPPEDAILLDGG